MLCTANCHKPCTRPPFYRGAARVTLPMGLWTLPMGLWTLPMGLWTLPTGPAHGYALSLSVQMPLQRWR